MRCSVLACEAVRKQEEGDREVITQGTLTSWQAMVSTRTLA